MVELNEDKDDVSDEIKDGVKKNKEQTDVRQEKNEMLA
jgi:hypothetical protein